MSTVKYKSEKTHPNVSVIGSDEDYLFTAGFEVEKGRDISYQDVADEPECSFNWRGHCQQDL